MWLVLHAPAGFFSPLFFFFTLWRGCKISRVIVPNFPSQVSDFQAVFLCDKSRAHWGSAGGGEEYGVLTLELSQYELPRTTFPPNQSIHSGHSDPRSVEERPLNGCFERSPFDVWGAFEKQGVPSVTGVSDKVVTGGLTDWVGGVNNTYYVYAPCTDGSDMGPLHVSAQFFWNPLN